MNSPPEPYDPFSSTAPKIGDTPKPFFDPHGRQTSTGLAPTCGGCGWIMFTWDSIRGWHCSNVACMFGPKVQNDTSDSCPHCNGTGKKKRL